MSYSDTFMTIDCKHINSSHDTSFLDTIEMLMGLWSRTIGKTIILVLDGVREGFLFLPSLSHYEDLPSFPVPYPKQEVKGKPCK